LATSGPVIEGAAIAVDAGASGATATGGGGTTSTGCCAEAGETAPNCHAADPAMITAATGNLAHKNRFIGFFPQPEAAVRDVPPIIPARKDVRAVFCGSVLKIETAFLLCNF